MHVDQPTGAVPTTGDIRHALIVDDHAVVRLGLVQLLRQLQPGLTVSEAATLAQCEATLAARPDVELVVLDVHLPDVPRTTPLWGLRRLRQQHRCWPWPCCRPTPTPTWPARRCAKARLAGCPSAPSRVCWPAR